MDDQDLFLKKCLPVLGDQQHSLNPDASNEDKQLEQISLDAQQYLLSVRKEALSYPCVLLPDGELPYIATSPNTRDNTLILNTYQTTSDLQIPANSFDPLCLQKFLDTSDKHCNNATHEKFWKNICFNEQISKNGIKASIDSKPLNIKLLSALNKKKTLQILDWFCTWLCSSEITNKQAYSIFLLLMRLDPLLSNKELYILRSLSRKLIDIRNSSDPRNSPEYVYTNILISIISTTFGQQDLV
ncbi:hypothetical protein BB561_000725 [Smittium simulii]|uniref:Gem-associated protein 2 n=1 Tax=Smittium simulii TaxID=133385 RepID=A0A2T9YXU6_9FUNG|nr:hypothetical protein BB561_000725 [Smittium simulii]